MNKKYSGIIKCHQELDRETLDSYVLKLVAIDGGSPRMSSTSTILLTVADSNDEVPRFTRLYSLNVTEGTRVGSHLLTVDTVDLDTPVNSNVTYSFLRESNPDGTFKIHLTTGRIILAKSLDREVTKLVNFIDILLLFLSYFSIILLIIINKYFIVSRFKTNIRSE